MRKEGFLVLLAVLTAAVPAFAGTVAYWEFEEGIADMIASGAGSILDWANDHHGTPYGTDGPVYRNTPIYGGSLGLEFDGINDRVFVPDDSAFALTESLTLEAIIKVDAIDTTACDINLIVIRADDRGGLDPYFLAVGEHDEIKDISFVVWDSEDIEDQALVDTSVVLGQWLHVAGTLDHATGLMRLYINGSKVDEITTDIRPLDLLTGPNPGIGIGDLQSGGFGSQLDGTIAAIRISDTALTPDQFLLPPTAIPLPSTLAMLLGGLALTSLRRRSKS